MTNDYFRFKKFTIKQEKCAMKVGTDGVLLGAWVSVDACESILDVGTGTGLISLMLAQRSNARVEAIDIDGDACLQAKENISESPYADRINVQHTSFADFVSRTNTKFDLIVSNPPFFTRSLQSPDRKRNVARHTTGFSFIDLLEKSCGLLTPKGRVSFIIPYEQESEMREAAAENTLSIVRLTHVYPTIHSVPKRLLVELSFDGIASAEIGTLTIEESRHHYTPDFQLLTKDFYLDK